MFKSQFGSALMRLFCLLALALSFTGLAHAQAPARPVITLFANPPSSEGAPATFRVTLSSPATQRLTFSFDSGGGGGPTGAFEAPQGPFDADFNRLAARGDYTFEVGTTQVNISVPTIQDTSYEFDENFFAAIFNFRFNGQAAGNTIILGQTSVNQTIINDDNPPDVTLIQPDPILEGDTNNRANQNYNFTVNIGSTLQDPNREVLGRPITLAFTTTDGTAVSNGVGGVGAGRMDFTPVSNAAVDVPAGTRQFQYTVNVIGDDVYEGDESFGLRVEYSPPLANTQPSTTVGNIRDNDLPTYSIDPADPGARTTVEEGNPVVFIVVLRDRQGNEVPALSDITFNYSVQNVTATVGANATTAGADFTDPNNGRFTIARNSSRFTLVFPTIDDNAIEQTETFRFLVRDAVGTIAPQGNGANVGVGTILDTADNNAGTVLTIQDATVVEGTGTTSNIEFTVNLSRATSQSVSVSYQTVDSTDSDPNARAIAGTDYTPTNGRLTFAPGDTARTFTVPITADAINELDENFNVRLFNPTNAAFANNAEAIFAKGTILDDDAAGIVTVERADIDVPENVTGGIVNIPVRFEPSGPQIRPVTVDFVTLPDTAQQVGQRDYFGKAGRLTFRPGVTQLQIPIEIIDDNIREGNESFTVRLTAVNGATFGSQTETRVRILDNEGLPQVRIAPLNARYIEGNTTQRFNIFLLSPSQSDVTVGYEFTGGTATNNSDYEGENGTVTFVAGGPQVIAVTYKILDDGIAEGTENFTIQLNPVTTNFAFENNVTSANVEIVDNDRTPEITIGDAQVDEGSTGDVNTGNELVFPVTLSRPSSRPVTFAYSTLNFRQPDCTPANGCDVASNTDYAVARNVLVTIPAGETAGEIRIRIAPDALNEFNEQFAIVSRNLVNAVPAVYTDPNNGSQRFGTTAFGTIVNDDAGGNITISGPTDTEGAAITGGIAEGYNRGPAQRVGETASFEVTLPAPAGRAVTVNYAIMGAANRADVQDLTTGPGNGRVTFFNGDVRRTIILRAVADNLAEGPENLQVVLSIADNNGPNGFTANNAVGRTTILDRTPFVNTVAPTIGFPAYGTVAATRVTINGSQLRTEGNPRVDAVLFNGVPVGRGGIQYLSDNSLTVGVPDGAKTGPLRLRLVDGSLLTTTGLTPRGMNAPPAPVIPDFVVQPVISSFSPTTGVPNGTRVTLTGRNFQDGNNAVTAVQFTGASVAIGQGATVVSDTRIEVIVPQGAINGPISIASARGGVGPASQASFAVVGATPGSVRLGDNPDRSPIIEGSTGTFDQPVRNFNGTGENTFHRPYLVFINPARQNGGANNGQPLPQTPVTVRIQITASTPQVAATDTTPATRIPDIAVRGDLTGAGRPTKIFVNSGRDNTGNGGVGRDDKLNLAGIPDGVIEVKLDEFYNPANPLEVAIIDAGTDNVPPIVGGTPAKVKVTATIINSPANEQFFPNTPNNQGAAIEVDRIEPINNTNQTAIAFGPGTRSNFSVPFSINNTNSVAIADLFDTPPVVGGTRRYQIFRLDVANQSNQLNSAGGNPGADFVPVPDNGRLERGIGYRLVVADTATVQLRTRAEGLVTPAGNSFVYNLTRNVAFAATANSQGNATNGYNFIGFPFDQTQTQSVDFNQALVTVDGVTRSVPDAASAGLISPQLFTLNASGQLVPAGTVIMPFQAYFVQIFRDNVTLNLRR